MRTFTVSGRRFFELQPQAAQLRCSAIVQQLVDRFDLAKKRVLSIGSGDAHEEFTLWRAGGDLTLVDIDEHHGLTPCLAKIETEPVTPPDRAIRYLIGDARNLVSVLEEKFDVCYISSFTPDELRRKEVQSKYRRIRIPFANAIAKRVLGRGLIRTWPDDVDPFHEIVESVVDRHLAPGGIFVHQSYAYGVELLLNPHWLGLIRRQLERLGVQVVSLYSFVPQSHVSLTVGFKGDADQANRYLERIARNKDILDFHGRSSYEHQIRRWFP